VDNVTPKPLPEVKLPPLKQVGKPLRRVDALGKAATVYAADFSMPNMLHAKVLRSTRPSARIVRLDVSKARELPGVVCILTGEDVKGAKLNTDLPGQTGREARAGSDAPVLALDTVRYVGEPMALVCAESLEIAEAAMRLIDLQLDDLPGVFTPEEALTPGAPILFDPDNVVSRYTIRKGDLEAGMAEADEIVERTFKMPFVEHAYLEPDGGVAWVDEQGVINIRVCTQVIEHFRSIARALGVPQNRIRVRGTMVGGGFGSKEDITVEIFLKDGRITASQIAMAADSGAYPYLTPYVLLYATGMAAGPYKIDHVHVDAIAAATNQTFTSAFRGFGGPQAALGYEQQMDEIAKVLGLDPLEVRRANYMQTGDTTCTGQEVSSAVWSEECATRALHALGERTPDTPTRKIGRGLASTFQSYGRITWFHDTSQAWVGVEQDGTVQLRCGVPDIGAGQSNSICQIAAEILGVPLDRVTIYATDSAVTPLAGTSTATRQLYMSGNAVTLAANAVRERLVKRAAEELGAAETELDLEGSRAVVASDPSRFIELADLVHLCAAEGIELSHLAQFNAPFTDGLDPETGQGDIWPDFTFGAVAVEVAVDTETGQIEVLKCAACHDVGRAINPAAVQGQIAGGTHQGLGYALMEEFVLENGLIKTPSLAEYLVPTALDFPETDVIILESGTGVGPFGAKGIGEPALTPAAPAVANAVADAIGTRIAELPLTPKRILEALGRTEEGDADA